LTFKAREESSAGGITYDSDGDKQKNQEYKNFIERGRNRSRSRELVGG